MYHIVLYYQLTGFWNKMLLSWEIKTLGHEVLSLNLPAVTEVTVGSHSSSGLTIPRCQLGTRPWLGKSELTPKDPLCTSDRECRQWCIHPGSTKWWHCHCKKFTKKKNMTISSHLAWLTPREFHFLANCEQKAVCYPWMTPLRIPKTKCNLISSTSLHINHAVHTALNFIK